MLNGKQISGTGGALDFVRGARLTKNGRSIIALPATAAKGTRSRIILRLDKKAVVSVPRTDVDYVVTEYGAVRLAHKSTEERAIALISIAAPQFRAELFDQLNQYLS
jgi:4-hydroxybutyrate CoA-transferase